MELKLKQLSTLSFGVLTWLVSSVTEGRAEVTFSTKELYEAAVEPEIAAEILESEEPFLLLPLSLVMMPDAADFLVKEGVGHLPAIFVYPNTAVGDYAFQSLLSEDGLGADHILAGIIRIIWRRVKNNFDDWITPEKIKREYRELDERFFEVCRERNRAVCRVENLENTLDNIKKKHKEALEEQEKKFREAMEKYGKTLGCYVGASSFAGSCLDKKNYFKLCLRSAFPDWHPSQIEREADRYFPEPCGAVSSD
jgi:hypothetical protein